MQCPTCGYRYQPFDRFCPRCARLGAAAPPTHPQVGPDQPYKVCPACGQTAVSSMPVCGRCGFIYGASQAAAVAASIAAPPTAPPEIAATNGADAERRGWRRVALVTVLMLLALLLGGAWVVRNAFPAAGGATVGANAGRASGVLSVGGVPSDQIRQRLLVSGASTGTELEVSLAWNSLTDLDLLVREPSGTSVWAEAPQSASGGQQDVDANPTPLTFEGEIRYRSGKVIGAENTVPIDNMVDVSDRLGALGSGASRLLMGGGDGKAPPRYTRTPIEHMYWRNPPAGSYGVYVSCFCWRERDNKPLPFTVEVSSRGRVIHRWTGVIGPQSVVSDGASGGLAGQFTVP